MHVLHAIHDFLPRHQAGSELYAFGLAQAQIERHDVTVLCAEYDLARDHGQVTWRMHEAVPVVEIVNNWRCRSFDETYRPPLIGDRIRHVLQTLQPDVVHIHNLLNLSFDLPAMAKQLGIPVVATLHDYTLLCASGGQRVHRRDRHVCVDIDTARCARCFAESPFSSQTSFASLAPPGRTTRALASTFAWTRSRMPDWTSRLTAAMTLAGGLPVTATSIDERMAAARQVFHDIDLFVSPSGDLAREYLRFGLPADRIRISDYGMTPLPRLPHQFSQGPLRIGMVGTLAWHKGAHVLVDALKLLPSTAYRASIFGSLRTFPDYVAEVRASAAGLPVDFRGGFPARGPAEAYAGIDVLVVPSLWPENSPLVIHEAFQAGVPVVGARIGGIPGLVDDGVSGLLFEPGSAVDLARALLRLIENPGQMAAMAAAAPQVKTIAEDAVEWDQAYAQVMRETRQ